MSDKIFPKVIPNLDLSLPGHNYLGPGNPIQNGEPVDSDDEIALEHDRDYENAKTSQDVRKADRKAIGDFTGNFIKSGNWHNAVGATGLTAKYAVETVTGVIYPNNNAKKEHKDVATSSEKSSEGNKLDLSLPGHNYLGPGNPIKNGEPADSDDEIAREHDRDYENATSSHDIRKADRKAIGDFTGNFIKTGNLHNVVGATGLTAKYAVETVTGVIYPNNKDNSNKKSTNEDVKSGKDSSNQKSKHN